MAFLVSHFITSNYCGISGISVQRVKLCKYYIYIIAFNHRDLVVCDAQVLRPAYIVHFITIIRRDNICHVITEMIMFVCAAERMALCKSDVY